MTRGRRFLVLALAALLVGALAVAQEEMMVEGYTEQVLQTVPIAPGGDGLVQAVFEFGLEPGVELPAREQPQLVAYVVEGTLSVSVDGGPETAYEAGSTFVLQAGSTVALANRGSTPTRALCFAILPEGALEGE